MIDLTHEELALVEVFVALVKFVVIVGGFVIISRQIRVLHKQISTRMDEHVITLSKLLLHAEVDTKRVAEEKVEEEGEPKSPR